MAQPSRHQASGPRPAARTARRLALIGAALALLGAGTWWALRSADEGPSAAAPAPHSVARADGRDTPAPTERTPSELAPGADAGHRAPASVEPPPDVAYDPGPTHAVAAETAAAAPPDRTAARIAGRVEWPDGTPAAGAAVRAVAFRGDARSDSASNDDGRFSLAGASSGPHAVRAELLRQGLDGASATTWIAIERDVAGGTTDLVLVLRAPPGLAGRVVDEHGAPVGRFDVVATPVDLPGPLAVPLSDHFEAPDGSFRLAGAAPGFWTLQVRAMGYVQIEDEPIVRVPAEKDGPGDGPTTVVLHRAARVAGRVLDPGGQPVPGAYVYGGELDATVLELPRTGDRTICDAAGRFELIGLPPGPTTIVALSEGFASSAPLELTLDAGALDGIELYLRVGGTLTGEVLRDGRPCAGCSVGLVLDAAELGRPTDTDERGRFAFVDLPSGSYNVFARGGRDDVPLFATAEVRAGETTHVVLGAPAREIRVHGRLTFGGEPLQNAHVTVLGRGGAVFESLFQARLADDGSYEATLSRPGPHTFFVEQLALAHHVEIPDADDVELDLALPGGTISGTVRGAKGPVDVVLFRQGGSVLANFEGGHRARTDDAGRYVFSPLVPGRYGVSTKGTDGGRQVRCDLVLGAGERLDGVDFDVPEAVSIAGVVHDDEGRPVRAMVFFRDGAGHTLHPFGAPTGALGRFERDDLAAGPVSVLARTRDGRVAEVRSTLVTGAANEVELVVERGTLLRVLLRDTDGAPLAAELTVLDEEGRDHATLVTEWDLEALMTDGYAPSRPVVGPLPPGRWRVEAWTADGRAARAELVLAGEPEREVVLVLE